MRDCARHAPFIGAREGELTPAEASALAEHLKSCPRCAALAADVAATEGLVAEALLARAAQRDFAPFVDEVMEKIHGRAPAAEGALAWFRRHWRALAATALPALAAVAVFLYVRLEGNGAGAMAIVEVHAEGSNTVLQTSDGPVVLLTDDEDAGS